MEDVKEVARVVKQWLTLESEIAPEPGPEDEAPGAEAESNRVPLDDDIAQAKQGFDGEIEPVRQNFANLLFSGSMDWLDADDDQLESVLPEWFLPGSNDEYYLEQYANDYRTDIGPVLTFLKGRLELWARGEGRPAHNSYFDGTPGTEWYMYDGQQWLYGPAETGNDWQPMDVRAAASGAATAQEDGARQEAEATAGAVAGDAATQIGLAAIRELAAEGGIDLGGMTAEDLAALTAGVMAERIGAARLAG